MIRNVLKRIKYGEKKKPVYGRVGGETKKDWGLLLADGKLTTDEILGKGALNGEPKPS